MLLAAGVALALAGCGSSAHDQVKDKVDQFASAAAAKDYPTICREVLAPALVAHLTAAGITCTQAMRIALGSVRDPTLSIGRIIIDGNKAAAITLTTAAGQRASLQAIDLVKTAHGWRISSLSSPLDQKL